MQCNMKRCVMQGRFSGFHGHTLLAILCPDDAGLGRGLCYLLFAGCLAGLRQRACSLVELSSCFLAKQGRLPFVCVVSALEVRGEGRRGLGK